ncbi:MAG TPA: hypothetical protein VN915_16260 [Elusimicrobiota bacterium]|nr:hypothetical protein [Elusimicrobiota bacterium]
MTRFLDAALRLGFGVLIACAGLSAAGATAASDAPRAPEVLDASAGIVRSSPSAPAALALVRAGFVRFEARRSAPLPSALASRSFAPLTLAFSSVPAAPAAVRRPGSAPGSLSRGPPASA